MYNIPFLESVSQFAPYELIKVQSSFDNYDILSLVLITADHFKTLALIFFNWQIKWMISK